MRSLLQPLLLSAALLSVVISASTSVSTAASSSPKARGAEVFSRSGCAHCHGTAGVGGGKGPDLQLVRTRLKPKEIAEQIHDGGEVMPSYGKILTAPEIKDLVAYLCAKRKVIVKAPPAAPDIIAPAPDPR